jgi:hypothetical protein
VCFVLRSDTLNKTIKVVLVLDQFFECRNEPVECFVQGHLAKLDHVVPGAGPHQKGESRIENNF